MRDQIILQRYAHAYVDFAEPKIGLDRCVAEMKSLKWLLREEPELEFFMKSAEIPRAEKTRVLAVIFEGRYSDETITFINYLISKHRITLLAGIANQVRLKFAHSDLVDITLRTTFPLELELITRIKNKMEEKLKQKTNLYLELDPDLLGGVQVVIGNRIMDGSVRNRLSELKKKMLQSQVT
jgi:F-type H+-transporting ATPase subunit delta